MFLQYKATRRVQCNRTHASPCITSVRRTACLRAYTVNALLEVTSLFSRAYKLSACTMERHLGPLTSTMKAVRKHKGKWGSEGTDPRILNLGVDVEYSASGSDHFTRDKLATVTCCVSPTARLVVCSKGTCLRTGINGNVPADWSLQ
jgi:hypothetical protein